MPASMGGEWKNPAFLSLLLSISRQKNRNKGNCTEYAECIYLFSHYQIIAKNVLKIA